MHAGTSVQISYVPGKNKLSLRTEEDSWKSLTCSLSLSLLGNFHFTLSTSSRCQTLLTQICQQIFPGTSPGISSVQLVMHLCRVIL